VTKTNDFKMAVSRRRVMKSAAFLAAGIAGPSIRIGSALAA